MCIVSDPQEGAVCPQTWTSLATRVKGNVRVAIEFLEF